MEGPTVLLVASSNEGNIAAWCVMSQPCLCPACDMQWPAAAGCSALHAGCMPQ